MLRRPATGEVGAAVDLWRAQRQGVDGLARRRETRLATLLAHASARSRFYRRHYEGHTVEASRGVELATLPPVTKPELMASFDDWVTDPGLRRDELEAFVADPSLVGVPYRGEYFVCTSSGTTGHPGVFVHDRTAVTVWRAMMVARIDLNWLTAGEWARLAARRFRWAAVVGTSGHFAGAGWIESERRRGGWRARSYRPFSVQRPLAELAATLAEFDPGILTAYPSALQLLAEEQSAGRLHLRPVVVETAGESTSAEARAAMAAAFGVTVHDAYSASECPWMAFDCRLGWLHVNSDWVVLEPVDEDYGATPPGEPSHTVLLTNLANHAQPLIRYDLGDSVLARPDPCPCGSPLPAVRVMGRCDDVLRLSGQDGSTVSILPLAIGSVVEETASLHRSQLIQTGDAEISLRLEARPGAGVEQTWRSVTADLHAYLASQGLANVRLVRDSEPPQTNAVSGKFRQVIARPPD